MVSTICVGGFGSDRAVNSCAIFHGTTFSGVDANFSAQMLILRVIKYVIVML